MSKPYPPKICATCGLALYSLKAKIRHEKTDECKERMDQKRRNAAAAALDSSAAWQRQS